MYTLDITISLGGSMAGTDLRAQLVDSAAAPVGAEMTAVALGSGHYLLSANLPDGHRGAVTFYVAGVPATILAAAAINPQEVEYCDAKTSSRLDGAGYTAPDNAGIAEAAIAATAAAGFAAAVDGRLPAAPADQATLEGVGDAADGAAAAAGAARDAAQSADGKLPADTAAKLGMLDAAVSSRSSHTAAQAGTDAAAKVLAVPANLLVTSATGQVQASNLAADTNDWSDAEKAQIRDALGVDGDKTAADGGSLAATLQAIKAKTGLIGSSQVQFVGSVNDDGTLDLVAGDDYLLANGKQLAWRVDDWGGASLAGASMVLALVATADYEGGSVAAELVANGTVAMDGQAASFIAELAAEQTLSLSTSPPGVHYNYVYQVRVVTAAGNRLTITTNSVHVEPGVAP